MKSIFSRKPPVEKVLRKALRKAPKKALRKALKKLHDRESGNDKNKNAKKSRPA
jgi:hypothetical protein